MSHPSLTPAEAERLEMLAEEANEIGQSCMKALRHGYDSSHPDNKDPQRDNRRDIADEVGDLMGIFGKMEELGDLSYRQFQNTRIRKWDRALKYTHHQYGSPNG